MLPPIPSPVYVHCAVCALCAGQGRHPAGDCDGNGLQGVCVGALDRHCSYLHSPQENASLACSQLRVLSLLLFSAGCLGADTLQRLEQVWMHTMVPPLYPMLPLAGAASQTPTVLLFSAAFLGPPWEFRCPVVPRMGFAPI
jgi:hypothetical protein